ncbi:bifunctional diaminohydroxyphosphoribosylaminopyrimidine deaminase/5-amino-6-(5-phosphoribosylamino)uracil reductase RibD [Afifella marina]|uniref:Riboflavin biosynthesis protein RibD n=1 Tax=Afifella marina DSM 2698 TaxID=1120955 RepID=A0A1G5NIK8_AFIMA|nr:bifunctional diaminohydroxyphosphoribosylaminopyrimidine deaminase/5-amino-6-(5-phosphoribosylamino)uracil reductase RibD [Afifella marina]MBK1623586.1 riboflavin biosynthesis protein RibD [Afifella marina DSM 2698]MBK1626579.1 riboflavin biosynthesis protein RibD [Afifella marina]MBK5916128.1 riboflavin biosynthesis protein RibD [Afifella marina]RAI21669.1 riboflavin biosynthesis protein RibD [Afifella marina DSM 2698]SCZ37245.1 diaminohydroxyphosphoribosylaminopyrimidine deaminase [Afifel
MSEAQPRDLDSRFLASAIRLGRLSLGEAAPNPAVGAIVVKDGAVVGRGRTAIGGRPHAETAALLEAGDKARGGTLYVSLEPCAHHGRTPPCADAIVAAGIGRVVMPIRDPDPRVDGKGVAKLRAAGVEVREGLLAEPARDAHQGYLTRTTKGRPYVLLKLALSADEGIGLTGHGQIAITGPLARRHVQVLRSRVDAILVGAGTLRADDPLLTCRLPGLLARSPIRSVLSRSGVLPEHAKMFVAGPDTWVLSPKSPSLVMQELIDARDGALRWLQLRAESDVPAEALAQLGACGVNTLLLEGGAQTASAFLKAGLVDELLLFRSPILLGEERIAAFPDSSVSDMITPFRAVEQRHFGPDDFTRYKRAA